MLRLPVKAACGVEDPDVDQGEDTLGGSGSYVNTDAMVYQRGTLRAAESLRDVGTRANNEKVGTKRQPNQAYIRVSPGMRNCILFVYRWCFNPLRMLCISYKRVILRRNKYWRVDNRLRTKGVGEQKVEGERMMLLQNSHTNKGNKTTKREMTF